MPFNSFQYVLFYITVLAISWMIARRPWLRMLFVLGASYYFYAVNNYMLVLLIILGPAIDYFAGVMIAASKQQWQRKLYLTLSLATNLAVLGYFKYANFFASSIARLAGYMGVHLGWTDLNIMLPAGISFYTFQSMSYAIDVYRNVIPAEKSFLRWNFYVTFFPHLIAGPIVRAKVFLPQAGKIPRMSLQDLESALFDIACGTFKKLVLADFLALFVARGFDHSGQIDLIGAWTAVYAFAFQIYFDFSGYTDIAIGCSRLMGYQLPINFNRPYMAYSASDFWRRWHISLSSWLKDYLYIPLGGNRCSKIASYRNVMITMLLGGLWHGAQWHFVLWGFMHGCFLIVERILGVTGELAHPQGFSFKSLFRRFAVFNFVVLTWLVFRCPNLPAMWHLVLKLCSFASPIVVTKGTLMVLAIVIGGFLSQVIGEYVDFKKGFTSLPLVVKSFAYACVCILCLAVSSGPAVPFIYFQF